MQKASISTRATAVWPVYSLFLAAIPYKCAIRTGWEGWFWGAKHVWGGSKVGEMAPMVNLYPDIAKHSDMLLFWGCDPETTPNAIGGYMASRLCYWLSDLGIKSVYVCPDLNYGAAVHADKWIPVLPNTDAALYLAIINVWLNEGIYDKEYVKTHVVGYKEFFDYVLGKTDGLPKDNRSGLRRSVAFPSGPSKRWRAPGPNLIPVRSSGTAAARSVGRIPRSPPAWLPSVLACRAWASPGTTRRR